MGQSTDAILIYGIDFGEEPPWHEFEEGDTDERQAAAIAKNPLGYLVWDGGVDGGVMIEQHCSGEAPMYIVGVKASRHWTWRGQALEVKSLEVLPGWDAQIDAFCAKHTLKPEKRPAWLLVSWWS